MYLSGSSGGTYPMNDDEDRIAHGFQGAQEAADHQIRRLHWGLSAGGEGDLNDVLYTVKALGMVVTPGGGTTSAGPPVTNGFSFRWQAVFGGGKSTYAVDGVDPRRLCRRPCTERDGRLRRALLHRAGDRRSDTFGAWRWRSSLIEDGYSLCRRSCWRRSKLPGDSGRK